MRLEPYVCHRQIGCQLRRLSRQQEPGESPQRSRPQQQRRQAHPLQHASAGKCRFLTASGEDHTAGMAASYHCLTAQSSPGLTIWFPASDKRSVREYSRLPQPAADTQLQRLVDNQKQDALKSSTELERRVKAPHKCNGFHFKIAVQPRGSEVSREERAM